MILVSGPLVGLPSRTTQEGQATSRALDEYAQMTRYGFWQDGWRGQTVKSNHWVAWVRGGICMRRAVKSEHDLETANLLQDCQKTFVTPAYITPYQSTSIPFLFNSSLAISISPINSLCASGTSLKVNTPHPSLNRR